MKRLFYILVLSILIQSCEENSTTPTNNEDVLIPLKVGNYWKAVYTEYGKQGDVMYSYPIAIYITKDSIWNNEKIYKISSTADSEGEIPIFWLNRSDGFYDLDFLNGYTEPRLRSKYPAVEGDYFMFEGDTTFIDMINVDYTVPAGTFKCYKYLSETEGFEVTYKTIHYACPGIGAIATENYYQDEYNDMYLESKLELIEYKIK